MEWLLQVLSISGSWPFVFIGIVVGRYLKPAILLAATVPVGVLFVIYVYLLLGGSGTEDSLRALIFLLVFLAKGLALVIPMWITYFLKDVRRDGAWLRKLKEHTIDSPR